MNCCDYDCHQGRDCPARSAPPDETPMSHTTLSTHGHTVTVTGPKAGELAKRIRRAEEAHQARMQYLAMPSPYASGGVATQSQAGASMAPQITNKPSRTRRVLRLSVTTGDTRPMLTLRVIKMEQHTEEMAQELADKITQVIALPIVKAQTAAGTTSTDKDGPDILAALDPMPQHIPVLIGTYRPAA